MIDLLEVITRLVTHRGRESVGVLRITTGRNPLSRQSLSTALLAAISLGVIAPAYAAGAPIEPGVMISSPSGQCTSNFVFTDHKQHTFLGQAAHCTGRGSGSGPEGCAPDSLPVGTKVEVEGATRPGRLAYNSWLAMQKARETDPNACEYNDFALVKLARADRSRVDPSVRGFGGPAGLGSAMPGESVFSYGNSALRGGSSLLGPKQGSVVGTEGRGWSRTVLTVTPGIPGDSGSGYLNATGQAIGVLSTLEFLPRVATNGVTDLPRALSYARRHSALKKLRLVRGDRPFRPNLVRAVLAR